MSLPIRNVVQTFNNTLFSSKLIDVGEDMLESLVDNTLNDGIVKDIPIIGAFVGIIQTTQNISNYLFLRKIVAFLSKIKDVSPQQREKEIKRIDKSGKYRESVGNSLLAIIDKCENVEKAEYLAVWFRSFLTGEIGYECFMYGTHIIQRAYLEDFKEFIWSVDTWKMVEDATDEIMSGLYRLDLSTTLMAYKDAIEGYEHENDLGYVTAVITDIGNLMREIFNNAITKGIL